MQLWRHVELDFRLGDLSQHPGPSLTQTHALRLTGSHSPCHRPVDESAAVRAGRASNRGRNMSTAASYSSTETGVLAPIVSGVWFFPRPRNRMSISWSSAVNPQVA